MAAGEVCWLGQAANCCPQGPNGGTELCNETVYGISRCFGEGTNDQCLADAADCSFGDECCSGFCLPTATGYACGASCVAIQGTCTADADCCDDGACVGGSCSPNYTGCIPIAGECADNADCCSGSCDAGTHRCVSIIK